MGVLDRGGDRRKGRGSLGVNLWHPIVTNVNFVARLYESDALFPNYFGENLFNKFCGCIFCKIVSSTFKNDGHPAIFDV